MDKLSGKDIFVPRNAERFDDLKKPYLEKGYKAEEIHYGNLMPGGNHNKEELQKIKVVIGNLYLFGWIFPNGKINLNVEIVTGSFIVSSTNPTLRTLEGCPKIVGNNYSISDAVFLKNLVGAPEHIHGNFVVIYSGLESLEGCPKIIDGDLILKGNPKLTSIEGVGKVGGKVVASRNTSKKGMKKKIKITESQLRTVVKSRVNEMYDDPLMKVTYENEISDTIGQAIDNLIGAHAILNKVVDFDLDDKRNKDVLDAMNEIYTIVDKLQQTSPEAKPTQTAFKPKQ